MHALEAKTSENRRFWGRFQKNLVVWKLFCSSVRFAVDLRFQKNLVVWKRDNDYRLPFMLSVFQKNLVVWKHE